MSEDKREIKFAPLQSDPSEVLDKLLSHSGPVTLVDRLPDSLGTIMLADEGLSLYRIGDQWVSVMDYNKRSRRDLSASEYDMIVTVGNIDTSLIHGSLGENFVPSLALRFKRDGEVLVEEFTQKAGIIFSEGISPSNISADRIKGMVSRFKGASKKPQEEKAA